MKRTFASVAVLATLSMLLGACGGSATPAPAPAAAPQVDTAATKAAMQKEDMAKADATKEAMAMADATKVAMNKEEMAKADATKESMAMADATKQAMAAEATPVASTDSISQSMAGEDAMKQGEAMMLAKGQFTKVDAAHFANGQHRMRRGEGEHQQHHGETCFVGSLFKQAASRQQFPNGNSQTANVGRGANLDIGRRKLLRGRIAQSTQQPSLLAGRQGIRLVLCQSKVHQHDPTAIGSQHEVGGFDVTMDDPFVVNGL